MQFRNPKWIDKTLFNIDKYEDIPQSAYDTINKNFEGKLSEDPEVTILIPAWNEETNIVRCMDTISKQETEFAFEVLIINNNSTDRTQEALDRINVRSYLETTQGPGPARETGQKISKGKYILLADADCHYPKDWLQLMISTLKKPNTVAVYGRHCFLGDKENPRFFWAIYELFRDQIANMRHFKRPFLNCYGLNLCYVRKYGLEAGIITSNIRGEDGRLVFDMMKHGIVRKMPKDRAKTWTGYRTLLRDGSIFNAIINRLVSEFFKFFTYFSSLGDHDTKTSENPPTSVKEFKEHFAKKRKEKKERKQKK